MGSPDRLRWRLHGGIRVIDPGRARDAASSGAQVLVCDGTYVGTFVATVPLDITSANGAAATTLDADGAGTTLSVAPGSTVAGLTLTGGRASMGGGLSIIGPGG